ALPGDTPATRPSAPAVGPAALAARVLPVLAATLLIALSVLAFSRFALAGRFQSTRAQPTAQSLASVLDVTRRQVTTMQGSLPFTPLIPTYLPPGVAQPRVVVGSESSNAALRYLDLSWTLAYPLTTLHIRESALPLGQRGDYLPAAQSDPLLMWSEGAYQWLPGLVQGAPARCAVGEARSGVSIAVDVGAQGGSGACDTSAASDITAINVLRLTSLSLDAPYQPLTVLPPDTAGTVLHFIALKSPAGGGDSWEAYVDPARKLTRVTVSDAAQHTLYTDEINGNTLTRLDPTTRTYATICVCKVDGELSQLPTSVVTFFNNVNTYIGTGELWNRGLTQTSVGRLFDLALVGAPYQTQIFVDPATKRIIGAEVKYQSQAHPAGQQATSKLSPASGCPSFTSIQYQAVATAQQASALNFVIPTDYRAGSLAKTITC
ncbi:MAG: hypothetical protein ACHQ4H_15760, partial [Ktedonobacterales bacterium]